jgi:hypothetical protein
MKEWWEDKMGDWIQTYSGIQIDPLDPKPEQINIEDIARALSNICRFTGHTKEFYSVAEHSYWASIYVDQKYAMQALLHDGAEAYMADIAAPLKGRVSVFAKGKMISYKVAEAHLLGMIFKRFGLDRRMPLEVEKIDMELCYSEGKQLLPDVDAWGWYVKPIEDFKAECWPPPYAYAMFMHRYEKLKEGAK